ncbi:hypothetical protein EC973_006291 [Apophysomyces ossiformis]|uniref:PH domain-containing protein n=1 Tax=Apophysomyces ossiformis TaxID=679940 RepID=A0A8H7BNN5_9FUNG|nr:hypothetical protein EC973_006291 [Apophysomyces ossiformis]
MDSYHQRSRAMSSGTESSSQRQPSLPSTGDYDGLRLHPSLSAPNTLEYQQRSPTILSQRTSPSPSIAEAQRNYPNQPLQTPPPPSDPPVFPPTETAIRESEEAMHINRTSFKVVYASDVIHKPERGLLNKSKRSYFVLTNNHLLYYKSQQKAHAEVDLFDTAKNKQYHSQRIDKDRVILSLRDVFAVQNVIVSPNSFRIDHLHPQTRQALSLTLTVDTPKECERWIHQLRKAVSVHHPGMTDFITSAERYGAIDRISKQKDMVEPHDSMVIQKVIFKEKRIKTTGETQSTKEVFLVVLLAIGKFSLYVLPTGPADQEYIKSVERDRHGLLAIQSIEYEGKDDTIKLLIRQVGRPSRQLAIVSTFCESIIQYLRQAIDSIAPSLRFPTYQVQLPVHLTQVRIEPRTIIDAATDANQLDRFDAVLQAYCASLNLNKARFEYIVTGQMGARTFVLLPPNEVKESSETYTKYELLAIFRCLRHNAYFREISFAHHPLNELETWSTQKEDGWTMAPPGTPEVGGVLSSEIFSIFLSNNRTLRKIDLTDCRIGENTTLTSALTVLGLALRTGQVDLSQICIGENKMTATDLHTLVAGIRASRKPIKQIDLHGCGLNQEQVEFILQSLLEKSDQLRMLDLSSNCSTIQPVLVNNLLQRSKRLSVLRLRGFALTWTSGIFDNCRLKELDLGATRLDDASLSFLCQWMQSASFNTLEALHLDGCGLSGKHLTELMIAISQSGNRRLHLNVSANPIVKEVVDLPKMFYAFLQGEGPCSLSLSKTEWEDATLREFIDCMRDNPTVVYLDLSDIRIAGLEISPDTVWMLTSFLERNTVLKELRIGASNPATSKNNLAKAVTEALEGLKRNVALERLDLAGLGIGDQGAMVLAKVLQTNQTLRSIDIDDNRITIDGYRALLKAFETSLLSVIDLPKPRRDLRYQLTTLKNAIADLIQSENESKWFIVHSTGGEARNVKTQMQLQIQARQSAELSYKQITDVVDQLMAAVQKNREAYEYNLRQTLVLQQQAQDAAQELATAQLRLQGRGVNLSAVGLSRVSSVLSSNCSCSSNGSSVGGGRYPVAQDYTRHSLQEISHLHDMIAPSVWDYSRGDTPLSSPRTPYDDPYALSITSASCADDHLRRTATGSATTSYVLDSPGFISDFGIPEEEEPVIADKSSSIDNELMWENQVCEQLQRGLYLSPDQKDY